jgi:lysozyme
MSFNLVKNSVRVGGLSAVMALALPLTAHHEGLRLRAYLDPVGIPTICYGETKGVALGQVKSKQECDDMLTARLGYFAYQVDKSVTVPMTAEMHAALASFAYNVGMGAFNKSTLLRKLNAGDYVGACNELPRWMFAGGKVWAGLVKRRAEERALCLSGANDIHS